MERGDPDSAEALVLTVLEADPRDAEAAAWLAELSVRRGRVEEAAERAAAILAERPGTERALLVRAVALAELGRTAAAREAFGALVRESPGPAFHWANFAAFEAAAGRAPEAVRLYREAVDRDPRNLTAYRGLLEAAIRAGRRRAGPAGARGPGIVGRIAPRVLVAGGQGLRLGVEPAGEDSGNDHVR